MYRLITELGWKGAMLVISVMILAIIMFGCLMRPLDTAASPDQEVGSPILTSLICAQYSEKDCHLIT